ncbi:MAG: hypothetical protein ACTII7_07660 [Galactobacter sp.]
MTTIMPAPRVQVTPAEITAALELPRGQLTVSVTQAAVVLGEQGDQVRAYCCTGVLQATKGGGGGRTSPWRIPVKALAAFMNAQPGMRGTR